MPYIPSDALTVPENRIRRVFEERAIRELADSIESKGILHPPCLRDDGKTLLAGERRLRAMALLHAEQRPFRFAGEVVPPPLIPYTTASDLSPLLLREAELEENVIRRDLPWQDYNRALDELRQLREAQAEAKGEPFNLSSVLEEVTGGTYTGGRGYEALRNAKVINEHLDDPEVSKAPDEKTALKIITRKKENEHRAKLAETFDLSKTPHVVRNIDAFELLASLNDEQIDIILTDPPYGMGADNFGDMASERHCYEDSEEWFAEFMPVFAWEAARVMKQNAHLYMFCDLTWFPTLSKWFVEEGLKVFRTPIIWYKGGGMLPWPEHGPRRTYETILFAMKGKKKTLEIHNDVILRHPKVAKPRWGAEKPATLYQHILARSAEPGNIILDPFAGAGPIIPAANALQLRAIVGEIDLEKFNYILTRLDERPKKEDIAA